MRSKFFSFIAVSLTSMAFLNGALAAPNPRQPQFIVNYGAACDGVADDAPAIQAAIADVPASGGIVQLCELVVIRTQVHVNKPMVKIAGYGTSGTLISLDRGHTFDVFDVSENNVQFEGFTITNFSPPTGSSLVYGIATRTGNYGLSVNDITMNNLQSGILVQGPISQIRRTKIFGSNSASGRGIDINFERADGSEGEVLDITDTYISGGFDCVLIRKGSSITIAHTEATNCYFGLLVQPDNTHFVHHLDLQDFWADTSASTGIILDGQAAYTPGATAGDIYNVRIVGSWMSSSEGSGLLLQGKATGVSVSAGSTFVLNKGHGIVLFVNGQYDGFIVEGSKFAANGLAGFFAYGGVGNFSVVNNFFGPIFTLGGNGTAGVYVAVGGSDNYLITGNRACANGGAAGCGSTTGIIDLASGSNKVIANNLQ